MEWVAVPFSRESPQPRGWTQVSHIAGDSLSGKQTYLNALRQMLQKSEVMVVVNKSYIWSAI